NGTASIWLKLPNAYGQNVSVQASASTYPNTTPVTFAASTVTGTPHLDLTAGDGQSGEPYAVSSPFTIHFTDGANQPARRAPVIVAITDGGGALASSASSAANASAQTLTLNTNDSGDAQVWLKLPNAYGRNISMTASSTYFANTTSAPFSAS